MLKKTLLAVLSSSLLIACTTTGQSFNTAGIKQLVIGQSTMADASQYLKANPVDVWQQGDTVLARWAYKNTVATDAIYVRQEAWLRFGADGTFQAMENTINIPPTQKPQAPPEQAVAAVAATAPGDDTVIRIDNPVGSNQQPGLLNNPNQQQPLLTNDTEITPGVTYPVKPLLY